MLVADRAFPSRVVVFFTFAMRWISKVKNSDGSIAEVVTGIGASARSAVVAHRSSRQEARIVVLQGPEE